MANSFWVYFPRIRAVQFLIGFLVLAIAACTPTTSARTPDPVATQPSTLHPATQTPTLEPSFTPTPPRVILLIPSGADTSLASSLQERLDAFTRAGGLQLEQLSEAGLSDLDEQVKLVVALPPNDDLAELAAQAPGIHFLAVGIPGLQPADNLQTVSLEPIRPDQQAFLAGYLAAVITPDWRVGVISEAGSVAGKSSRLGFTNGATFFCGLCRPAYPPFPQSGYPMAYELGSGAGETDWQAAITEFQAGGVQTIYVDPAIATEALLQALAQADFHLISGVEPPPGLEDHWVASITASDPLQVVEAALMTWTGETSEELQNQNLRITNVNEDLLSPGRLRLVEVLKQDLIDGYVDTGVDPATGDSISFEQPAQ